MKPGTLALGAAVAASALLRRRELATPLRLAAAVAVAALVVSGSGLVALPSPEVMVREATAGLGQFTYLAVGALAFAETGAFVGLIAPGELAVLLGGVAAGHGTIELPILVAIVWACAFAGDLTSFLLGRRLGRDFLLTYGSGLGVTEDRLAAVERTLAAHRSKTVVLGRFLGFVRPLTPFLLGAARTPARRFVPITCLASGLWSATFCGLGYAFWESLDTVIAVVERGSLALGVLATLAVGVVVLRRRLSARRPDEPAPARAVEEPA